MAIFLTEDSKVIVQGMTGSEGSKHTQRMLASGTNIVGGVNPRKAGQRVDFDGHGAGLRHRRRGVEETGADVSVVFVPPRSPRRGRRGGRRRRAARRGDHRGCAGARTPRSSSRTRRRRATRIIGPNCPGLISPGKSNAGIIPADITKGGRIGLVSKSGTLTYQMMYELRDFGFSTACRHRRRPDHRHDAHRRAGRSRTTRTPTRS